MKIYLAADHAGLELKNKIKDFIPSNYEVVDEGAFVYDANDDYPDFISKAAAEVSKDPQSFGIVIGKSGAGEEIVANKFKNVRAVLGFSAQNVRLSRQHNNANVLSLGSDFTNETEAKELVSIFLETPFSAEERHVRRLKKLEEIENK